MLQNHTIPTIQNIENELQEFAEEPQPYILTDNDIARLFTKKSLPIFEVIEIKLCPCYERRELAQFFINKLEKWNSTLEQKQNEDHIRTQLAINQFIYSSLKRIALLRQEQIDRQLEDLYKWQKITSKGSAKNSLSMPKPIDQSEQYKIQKDFKTNAPLMIDQYWRKPFDIKYSKKMLNQQRQQILTIKKQITRKANNRQGSFITNLPSHQNKRAMKSQENRDPYNVFIYSPAFFEAKKKQSEKFLYRMPTREKIMQEEVRRYRELKQIENEKSQLQSQKARLMCQTSKKFYSGSFDTSIRMNRTSGGSRDKCIADKFDEIKKLRIRTGLGKSRIKINECPKNEMPQIQDITNVGLFRNPQQVKLKKKKKNK